LRTSCCIWKKEDIYNSILLSTKLIRTDLLPTERSFCSNYSTPSQGTPQYYSIGQLTAFDNELKFPMTDGKHAFSQPYIAWHYSALSPSKTICFHEKSILIPKGYSNPEGTNFWFLDFQDQVYSIKCGSEWQHSCNLTNIFHVQTVWSPYISTTMFNNKGNSGSPQRSFSIGFNGQCLCLLWPCPL
jgi:hypothetical protein